MLCVIYHLQESKKYHSDSEHRKQVNNIIKTLFHELSVYEMAVTKDLFWTEETLFGKNNGSFDGDEFIWKIKDIRDGNSHLWNKKQAPHCTRVLGFVVCRVTSKVLGIGVAERYWGDINTIKYIRISATRSYVSEKHIIVYTFSCVE